MWGKGHQVKSCQGQQIGQGQLWLQLSDSEELVLRTRYLSLMLMMS